MSAINPQLSLFPDSMLRSLATPVPIIPTPAPFPTHSELFLDVSDDCKHITAYRTPDETTSTGLSRIVSPENCERIADYPSSGLLYPEVYIGRNLPAENVTRLTTLYGRGRRLTRFQGVVCDWDQSIDRRVWTTNIDTVIFLRALRDLGILTDPELKSVAEIGVGGGHISASFAAFAPQLSHLIYTDINPAALSCAARNIGAYAGPTLFSQAYLGTGIQNLPRGLDLLVCNPPYIPIAPDFSSDETDPYRGTGLIREIVNLGLEKATRVVMSLSGMALMDLQKYAKEFGVEVKILTESESIPLKIESVNKKWCDWLVTQGGLQERDPEIFNYRHWHRLYTVEIKKK